MENTRIRINLTTKEFEVEGSEQFVKEYADKIESLLSNLANSKTSTIKPPANPEGDLSPITPSNSEIPETFGEYLHSFPSVKTDVERMLIAGYFVQSQSTDNSFATASASELLREQGIKPANPADCITKNKNAKRLFALSKGKFRVSQKGVDHINSLLAK